jgi:alcohol dehydrogenase
MKAVQITHPTDLSDITISTDIPEPQVGPGRVLVVVKAMALNPLDWKLVEGAMGGQLPQPFTPGSDFAGIVKKVGEGVTHLKKGDEVYGMAGLNRGGSGSLAELAATNAAFVWKKPTSLTFTQAAAVPMTGLRAWHVLNELLQIKPGDRVLIHGGAGGIGTFAIQIAKHMGAHIATTVSDKDIPYVQKLGADEAIDYVRQDFSTLLRGYNAVFDTISGKTLEQSFQVLKPSGRITSVLFERHPDLVEKYGVIFVEQGESATPQSFTQLGKLLEEGIVKIQIDSIYPFNEVADAFAKLKNGHPRGKVVVEITS